MVGITTEVKLRRQAASFSDYTGSLDESYMKSIDREQLTRSTSTFSSRSIDNVDPSLITNSSVTDCVDSVASQQLNGSRDIRVTSRRSACQVRDVCTCCVSMDDARTPTGRRSSCSQFYQTIAISTSSYGTSWKMRRSMQWLM